MKRIDKSTMTVIRCAIPLVLSFLIVVGVVFVAVFRPSLGWFSYGDAPPLTGMTVITSCGDCDVLIERTTEYDKTKGTPPIERYPGVGALKEYIEDDGYDVDTETSTDNTMKLAFELQCELVRSDYDDYAEATIDTQYLMPGAYGTLTFYLRPYAGVTHLRKACTVSVAGFYALESAGDYTIRAVTSPSTLDLLKGHLLFFTERTGLTHETYQYDGLVEGSFVYDSSEHELCDEEGKTDCYKVTLYWEWPETYIDISRNMSTDLVTKKYPEELGTYIEEHSEYFFAINQASEDENERSEGYDDGDQKIGNQVHFLSAFLTIN